MSQPPSSSPPSSSSDTPDDWAAQRAALRVLHREVLDAPLPPAMEAAARRLGRLQAGRQRQARWVRWGGLAASLVLAVAAGWIGHAQWQGGTLLARAPAARSFVHEASLAYVVYSPEKRHPVEVAAGEQQHLVQWLSRRLDRPLKVPDLSAQGYALVGGRLLPGGQGARAQFMFENGAGQRVTLYLGAVDPAAAGADGRETAFRFAREGGVPSFYWVDQGFGYALTGPLAREALLALATAVHRQL